MTKNPSPNLFGPSLFAALALSTPSLSGRIFSNVYVPTYGVSSPELLQSDTEGWLTATEKPNDQITARATVVGQGLDRPKDQLISKSDPFQVREAYVRYRDSGWDLQAGKVLLPWGKTDAINPTDYFSGWNYQKANWDREVQRIGPVAAVVSDTPDNGSSPATFTAVIAPAFAQDNMLIPPSFIPTGFTVNDPSSPSFGAGSAEMAVKGAYAGDGWDFSLSAFHGWNHFPDLSPVVISGTSLSTTPAFHRESAVGGDFSATAGSYVFRGETAYHWTENTDQSSPFISPPFLDVVAEVERPFGDNFRAQVQGTLRHVDDFRTLASYQLAGQAADPFDSAIAQANADLQQYAFVLLPGATARLSYTNDNGDWEAEIFTLAYFPPDSVETFAGEQTGPQFYIRPKISHDIVTGLKATLGLDEYLGPATSLFGASRYYSAAFFEALYVF